MRKLCQLWGTMIKKYFLNRKNIYLRQKNKKGSWQRCFYYILKHLILNLNLKHAGTPPPFRDISFCFSIKVIFFFDVLKHSHISIIIIHVHYNLRNYVKRQFRMVAVPLTDHRRKPTASKRMRNWPWVFDDAHGRDFISHIYIFMYFYQKIYRRYLSVESILTHHPTDTNGYVCTYM